MEQFIRVYVSVDATFDTDGGIVPTAIHWVDGTIFPIDRVVSVCRAASLKAGGAGMRYTCRIRGHRRYLFLEDIGKWFLECPANIVVRKDDDPC